MLSKLSYALFGGVLLVAGTLALVSWTAASAGAATGATAGPSDGLTAARFSITIDGYEIAAFSELVGITTEVEAVDFQESADKEVIVKKVPGKATATVVLKRGLTQGLELWAWHEAVRNGDIAAARKSASLVVYDASGKPVGRYHLENAWPSKLEVDGLKAAGGSQALFETATLVADHIQRVSS
jgi:phage tail-like protein